MKIKVLDVVVLFLLAGFSVFMLMNKPEGEKKLIVVVENKKFVLPFEKKNFDLKKEYGKNVIIQIENDRARIAKSDCPLKICVKTGWISDCGDFSICVPNKVGIFVECEKKKYDALSK